MEMDYNKVNDQLKEIGADELEKELFKKSAEFLTEKFESIKKDLLHKTFDDLENWMWERTDNVKRYFFDAITNYLLGARHTHVDAKDKETIDKYLTGIGYNASSFRKKLYDENKEEILNAIMDDAIYERLKDFNSFSAFKHWDFHDIHKGYPQTEIVKNFVRYLILKDGFEDYLTSEISEATANMKIKLDSLRKEVKELQKELDM